MLIGTEKALLELNLSNLKEVTHKKILLKNFNMEMLIVDPNKKRY